MTMTEFWETDHAVTDRVFFSFGELTRVNHNKVSYWLVGDNSRDSSMTFQYERYEPGMDGRELSTPVDTDIAGIVIEGKLEVTVGGQRRILRAGDAYRFNGTVPHRFRVIGKDPVVSVSCTVPPVF